MIRELILRRIQLLTLGKAHSKTARLILLDGDQSAELDKIKNYCINPVESREHLGKTRHPRCRIRSSQRYRAGEWLINMTDDGLLHTGGIQVLP